MKLDKLKTGAFTMAVCLLSLSTISCAQSNKGSENGAFSTTPVVTKGYYSIYNNAAELNSSAGRLTFSNKVSGFDTPGSNISVAPKKGYFSISNNAEKKRAQMTQEGINFSESAPARVNQSNTFPVIKKGYYSIGNNSEKLRK